MRRRIQGQHPLHPALPRKEIGGRAMRNSFKWSVTWHAVAGRVVDEFTIEARTREEAHELATQRCSWSDRGTTFRPFRLDIRRGERVDASAQPSRKPARASA